MSHQVKTASLQLAVSKIVQSVSGQTTAAVRVIARSRRTPTLYMVVVPLQHRRMVNRYLAQHPAFEAVEEDDAFLALTDELATTLIRISHEGLQGSHKV